MSPLIQFSTLFVLFSIAAALIDICGTLRRIANTQNQLARFSEWERDRIRRLDSEARLASEDSQRRFSEFFQQHRDVKA